MSLRRRSLALVILPLGLVLGLVLLIAVFGTNIQKAEGVARDTNAGLAASNDLLVNLLDAETSARGFVLTGESAFAAPYDKARARFESDLAALQAVSHSVSLVRMHIPRLEALARREASILSNYMRLARNGNFARARAL